MKILAIKLRAIGDTVIWTAALESLRAQYPQAEIHTLTYASNAAVLLNHEAVDVRHELSSRSHVELLRTLFSLRKLKFEWLLGFHATTSLCRWAWLAGARKMALHHHSWSKTPQGSVPIPQAGQLEDAIARDHRILQGMTREMSRADTQATRIYISEQERQRAQFQLDVAIQSCGGDVTLPRFVFLPGAGHHLRRYPKDLWLPMAESMLAAKIFQPVVIVDLALSQQLNLRDECERRNLPLLDQGSLREFMTLVVGAAGALANDSGPGHISVALNVPTHFVFGPGCVGDWHPYDKNKHPLHRIDVSCRNEGPRELPLFQYCTIDQCSHHRCMHENHFNILNNV